MSVAADRLDYSRAGYKRPNLCGISRWGGWRSTLCGEVNAAGALANTSGALGAS